MQKIGKYEIQKKIGSGGMGTVYLAFDEQLKRTVALKVLSSEKAKNPILVKRFKSEAQSAARLKDKNIITVYEAGEANNRYYIALEFFEGVDVHELVERHGVLSVKRSLDIIKKMTKALKHAYKQKIVHRDIKPSNIMISRKGEVKLTDMGLARILDDEDETGITKAGTTVGTVDYMSPEQARNSRHADTRSDLYSLGCTWYHMLTGEPPFPEGGLTKKLYDHASANRPDPRELNDKIPESIVAIIYRMMAKKADERYQSPAELLKDLDTANTTPDIAPDAIASAMTELAETELADPTTTSTSALPGVSAKQNTLPPRDINKEVESESQVEIKKSFTPVQIGVFVGIIFLFFLIASMMQQGPNQGPNDNIGADELKNRIKVVEEKKEKNVPQKEKTETVEVKNTTDHNPSKIEQEIPKLQPNNNPDHINLTTLGQSTEKPFLPNWVSNVWNSDTGQVTNKGLKTIIVGRNNQTPGHYKTLNEALQNSDPKGTIIELLGKGPFILSTTHLSNLESLIITGKEEKKPVVILIHSTKDKDAPLIHLTNSNLVLDHVDLYFDPNQQKNNPSALFDIESGHIAIRRSSLTVNPISDTAITGFHFHGTVDQSKSKHPTKPQILIDRTFFYGKNLLPLNIDKDSLNLCANNSLFLTGNSPVIKLDCTSETDFRSTDKQIHRDFRFISCTLIPFDHAFHFTPGNNSNAPPRTRIFSMNSVFGHESGAGSSSRLLELQSWPQTENPSNKTSNATHLRWFSQNSLFTNWNQLIHNGSAVTQSKNPSDDWANYWGINNSEVDHKQFQKENWPDQPVSQINDIHPKLFSKESINIPILKATPEWTPGVDSTLLPYTVLQSLSEINRLTLREFNNQTVLNKKKTSGKITEINLLKIRPNDLGKYLAKIKWEEGDIFEISGRGRHESHPIVLKDQSLHLRFVDTDTNPFYIVPKVSTKNKKNQYLFDITNGNLTISDGHLVINNSKVQYINGLIHLKQGDLNLNNTTIISKKSFSTNHQELIKWSGIAEDSKTQKKYYGNINNSFIISYTPLINIENNRFSLGINNSLFVSTSDIIKLDQNNSTQKTISLIDIKQSTFSTGRNIFQATSLPSNQENIPPLQIFIEDSVIAPAILSPRNTPSKATICDFQDSYLNKNVSWFGQNNGYSQAIHGFFVSLSQEKQTSLSEFWLNKWGTENISRPLYNPNGVSLKEKLGNLDHIKPLNFEFNVKAQALNWNSVGEPIGCDLKKLVWMDYRQMKKTNLNKEKSTKEKEKEKRKRTNKRQPVAF